MCGICGAYGLVDKGLIKRMCNVIRYRGPDDIGFYFDNNLMLGHRRLSIIDLKTGRQPIFNEDRTCCIIFNGEIYNFKELKTELERLGHRFYTNTDTEVIIHSYEEFGFDCVRYFNGMFAFAIWDSRKRVLFLARDRVGIKPLFYIKQKDKFIFASEIKSILQYTEIKREIDDIGLHYFVNLRYIPEDRTIFKNIKKLMPGHFLVLQDNKLTIKRYWEIMLNLENQSMDYFVKKIRNTFDVTIKRQLISDVPIASYLSGGIDSSAIVAYSSKYTENLKTFCLGFGEPRDEFKSARAVADFFGTNHHEHIIKFDILKSIPETIWQIDMPKRNMWPYFISKEIAKHVKVVLSGLGGDEVFGGYVQRYNFLIDSERIKNKISKGTIESAKGNIEKHLSNWNIQNDYKLVEWKRINSIENPEEIYTLVTHHNKIYSNIDYLKLLYANKFLNGKPSISEIFAPYFRKNEILDSIFLAEFNTKLPHDFLLVEDACSMAHGLEARVPFLDNEMVDLGFSIPSEYKVRNNIGKFILRKAFHSILPREILNRGKAGFVPNIMTWYKNEFRDFALETFPKSQCIREYFNLAFIMRILKTKPNQRLLSHYNLIWDLLCLDVWHKIYIEKDNLSKPKLRIENLY